MRFRYLYRNYTVNVELLNPLITFICYYLSLWGKVHFTLLENTKVMLFTFTCKNADNIPRRSISNNLNL